jgi:hypothetical protein
MGVQAPELSAMIQNTAALIALTTQLQEQALSGNSSSGGGGLLGMFGGGGGGGLFSMFGGGAGAGAASDVGGAFDIDDLGGMADIAGSFATGGYARAGQMYRVAEKGPELLDVGNESFLMMGSRGGRVTPNDQLATNGAPGQFVFHFHGDAGNGTASKQTMQQHADLVYKAVKRAQRDR